MCRKPVKCNQRGILCDRCELWTHIRCCGIDVLEYERLGLNSNEEWYCPSCLAAEFPFADVSLPSNTSTCSVSTPVGTPLGNLSPLEGHSMRGLFCHLNACSLLNKMDEIRSTLCHTKRPVAFGVSETWLNSSVIDNEVAIPSYDLYRRDRGSKGGGVLVYVAKGFRSKRRPDLEKSGLEAIWVELRVNKRTLLLGNVYRPPKADVLNDLETMIENVASQHKDMILMGDLNLNLLNPSNPTNNFLLSARDNNLDQLIREPTRITDHSQTLLDVLFTSNPDLFSLVGTADITGSDHLMIYGEINEKIQTQAKVRTIRSFKKCDKDKLMADLENAPWQVMDMFDDINEKWDYWKSLFLKVVEEHAPLVKVRVKNKVQDCEWIDSEVRGLMRTRNYFRKKYRNTRDQEDWNKFRELRSLVIKRLRVAKVKYYADVCKEISRQPKSTWRQLNTVLGRSKCAGINQIIVNDEPVTQTVDIVNNFIRHFSSTHACSLPNSNCKLPPASCLFKFSSISEDVVLERLSHLDERKATGPDKISAKLLRMVAPAVAASLTSLLNHSLSQGSFPAQWKEASVTPVPKPGDKFTMNNYRPISVIPVLAKVFEGIVHCQLYYYLEVNDILKEEQNGFRPKRSTQDVLLKTVDDWKKALDQGEIVATVLIDLSKAFDTINHKLLLEKLHAYGIRGTEWAWFSDYLSGRKQRVVLDGVSSEWAQVTMGVPQGSILGPLLFLVFINDLVDAIEDCTVNLYADDTTIYSSDKDPVALGCRVEADISRLAHWIQLNGMKMNVAKTQLMVLSQRGKRHEAESVQVKIDDVQLEKQDCVKYLGAMIDKDLSWKPHIERMHKQCMSKLAVIRRSGAYLPCHIRRMLYLAFVLPHLDYCSVVWNFCGATLIKQVERIQNYALRMILRKPPRTASEPLRQTLRLTTLEKRRHYAMLSQVHRYCTGNGPAYLSCKFTTNQAFGYTSTRGSGKLHLHRPLTEFYRSSFEFQGATHYNKLPKATRDIKSLKAFRNALLTE